MKAKNTNRRIFRDLYILAKNDFNDIFYTIKYGSAMRLVRKYGWSKTRLGDRIFKESKANQL